MKRRYEIHWRDFGSPLSRNEIWTGLTSWWPKLFGLSVVSMGIVSERDNISYYMDMPAAVEFQNALIKKITLYPSLLADIMRRAEKWGKELNQYTERIAKEDLKKCSLAELVGIYKRFCKLQQREYAIGVTLVMLDSSVGCNSLEHLVDSLVKRELPKKEQSAAYTLLTSPTRESFARSMERELTVLYDAIRSRDSKIFRLPISMTMGILKVNYPKLYTLLHKHTQRWAWIYYAYAGPAWQEEQFFELIADWDQRGLMGVQLRRRWDRELFQLVKRRKDLINRLGRLTSPEIKLLELISLMVWSKPRRKDYQSKSYWHMEKFYLEVARRLGLSLAQVRTLPQQTLYRALRTGKVSLSLIYELHQFHVAVFQNSKVLLFRGIKAKNLSKKIIKEKVIVSSNILKGIPACHGQAKGIVRLVNSPLDMAKMVKGDVLVSVATTPSIVSAMRKASAIITDEGGLTCHAAIVSRELNIPCIIGTKVATNILQDGDKVEVDATRGIIKKLR